MQELDTPSVASGEPRHVVGCACSKLNPHEFTGDYPAIASVHGEAGGARAVARSEPRTCTALLLEVIDLQILALALVRLVSALAISGRVGRDRLPNLYRKEASVSDLTTSLVFGEFFVPQSCKCWVLVDGTPDAYG